MQHDLLNDVISLQDNFLGISVYGLTRNEVSTSYLSVLSALEDNEDFSEYVHQRRKTYKAEVV
jgi:hypothetical protein